jgi:L-alanine-DL-glutamate epimerase-like enolase superfamily enzyme
MAHFAELYGTNIELNGQGGLFGLLHAHLGCCIDNTDFYEYSSNGTSGANLRRAGEVWGMVNAPLIVDGHIAPPAGPGWGAEWDEKRFQSLVVSVDGDGK